jgi:hypothetical protein
MSKESHDGKTGYFSICENAERLIKIKRKFKIDFFIVNTY